MMRFAKVIVSFIVVMAMMCSMVGVLAYGTNAVNGSSLVVEVIGADGSTVVGSWTDPATSALSNPIWVTAAQMIKITASLKDGGDITVFSYADGTTESALANDTIQYVGQEESGAVIKVRPRATLPDGEYVMYIGGEDVLTPYSFKYNVGEVEEPLGTEGIVTRVPKAIASGSTSVSYKITTALVNAESITDVLVNGVSVKDKCTVAYDETAQAWKLTIADVGYAYEVGTHSAVIVAPGYTNTTVQFTVYDVLNYKDGSGNVLHTSEIVDNEATLKPGTAFNGAKVASVDKYFTSWSYNSENYNLENSTDIPVVDGERIATIQTATPEDGYTQGAVISKAGAQWVKYKAVGDETEYDGIRFVALLDFDAKSSGMAEIDHVGMVVSNVAQAPTIEAGITKTESKTVYDAIYVRQGNAVSTMDVKAIKETAQNGDKKFSDTLDSIFYAIVKIPEARKDQKVYATPYVQFTDGSRIYGSAIVGADGTPGVTYNELKANDPGDTPDPEPLPSLEPADEILTPSSWKASWTQKLGFAN